MHLSILALKNGFGAGFIARFRLSVALPLLSQEGIFLKDLFLFGGQSIVNHLLRGTRLFHNFRIPLDHGKFRDSTLALLVVVLIVEFPIATRLDVLLDLLSLGLLSLPHGCLSFLDLGRIDRILILDSRFERGLHGGF